VKIEIAVPSKIAAKVVAAIKSCAGTDKIGDGKIFTLELADAMRIRTGETGADAL
jgi:nitrogen regulatory protein PII